MARLKAALPFIILFAVLGVALYFIEPKSETKPEPTFGGPLTNLDFDSPEARVVRFLAKMELQKNDPIWNASPTVQRVKNPDGSVNIAKVRELFIERGLATGAQFDTVIAFLESRGLITNNTITADGIQTYQNIKAAKELLNAQEDLQRYGRSQPL